MIVKKYPAHDNFFLLEHPLIKHKMFYLRDKSTSKKFKESTQARTPINAV